MFFRHIVLFFLLIEIFTLFMAVDQISFFNSFCLWLLSAFIGVLIIQRQGMEMLMRAQSAFNQRGVPVDNLFGRLCVVFAGLLFLMPGFAGDVLGLCLLIPYTRALLQAHITPVQQTHTSKTPYNDDVIDGSYVRVEEPVDVIEQKDHRS